MICLLNDSQTGCCRGLENVAKNNDGDDSRFVELRDEKNL